MASESLCRVEGCENLRSHHRTLCLTHKYRWDRYKSYEAPKKINLPDNILKLCKKHGHLNKDQVRYQKYTRKKDNVVQNCISIKCKICCQEWDINNYHRIDSRKKQWHKEQGFKKFNMSLHAYQNILKTQKNVCAICENPETAYDKRLLVLKRLAIDHCHKTGKIRGLLCGKCNRGIGFFNDNIETMLKAIEYLKAHY